MTSVPLLIKAQAYLTALTASDSQTPLCFNPQGSTALPWTGRQVNQGQGLAVLFEIEQELPSLMHHALISEEPLPIKTLCQIVHMIGTKAQAKLAKPPGPFCERIYYLRMAGSYITLLSKLQSIVFVRIDHQVDELLPILKQPAEADRLKRVLETIESYYVGPWTTPTQSDTLYWKKVFLMHKLEAMKTLWELEKIEKELVSSPLQLKAVAVHEAAIDKIYDRYVDQVNGLRLLQEDYYQVVAEKKYLEFLCLKLRFKAIWKGVTA